MNSKQVHRWVATHRGWLLLCPLYLANLDSDAPVPIPRGVPWWWFEFNLWLNDRVQWLMSLWEPEAVGYMFSGVHELDEPKEIEIPGDDPDEPVSNP